VGGKIKRLLLILGAHLKLPEKNEKKKADYKYFALIDEREA
jgi:hypothetical protein